MVSYTTAINWLKVLLPLVALGLLSMLFLFARTTPEEASAPFLEEIRRKADGAEGMRGPFYTGRTDAGDTVSVEADFVEPDPADPGRALARALRARIAFADGSELDVRSDRAEYSDGADSLRLLDDVVLVSTNGYEMHTEELLAFINDGSAETPGDVHATGPAGTITAGRLRVTPPETGDGPVQLVFTNGVKLIYVPQQNEE